MNISIGRIESAFIISVVAVTLSFVLSTEKASAQEPVSSPQEQCFALLKENMNETVLFETPLLELNKMSYADLSSKFGEKKQMLGSFDLTIDQPLLGIRIYSFGNQTGYTHPPKSVLPISSKSDTWGDPVKEYVVMEEYVTDPQGNEHFLDCVFLQVDSDNLMNVTQENYAYDNVPTSLIKTVTDESYKAWYNQASAFDYENNLLVTWKRLIIYPKTTQNNYFNRYDVMHTYPANKVKSFDVLNFFQGKLVSFRQVEGEMPDVFYAAIDEKTKEVIEVQTPLVLLPPTLNGINFSFPRATYFQAIESQFPEFGVLLSMRGTLKYATYKTLVTETNMTEDVQKFVSLALGNTQEIDSYYFAENKTPNAEFDKLIPLIQDADGTLEKLKAGETLATLTEPDVQTVSANPVVEEQPFTNSLIISILVSVLSIGGIVFILVRRKLASNTNTL